MNAADTTGEAKDEHHKSGFEGVGAYLDFKTHIFYIGEVYSAEGTRSHHGVVHATHEVVTS